MNATELPTLTDAGMAAIAANKPNAVIAIARMLKRQEDAQFARLEEIWGQDNV
ncbi:MAG: hypothetical protein ACRC62_37770 [Microcoleus sp.]